MNSPPLRRRNTACCVIAPSGTIVIQTQSFFARRGAWQRSDDAGIPFVLSGFMRSYLVIVGCILMCGCATQRPAVSGTEPHYTPQTDSPSLALAFDPPAIAGQPALYLDRESREPAAFAGYDQPTVTYSYLRINDFYNPDPNGNYTRQAVTEQLGVSSR
jgi:hypothetical protein